MTTSTLDFTIETDDLLALFAATRQAYKGMTFEQWVEHVKVIYENNYLPDRVSPMTFSQWINGQTISLTS